LPELENSEECRRWIDGVLYKALPLRPQG